MPEVFAEPGRLLLLLAAPVVAGLIALGLHRRRVAWRLLGLAGNPPPTGVWAWWFAAIGLIFALAEPRWGRVPGSELPPGHDVVILADVSRSMAAEDAVPDRLGLAISAARGLVDQLKREPGDRSAVVAFAGRAVARCPLTDNLDAVLDSLGELRPGMIEPGGTDLGSGLATALDAFDSTEHAEGRSIVVLSDGEDHAESWPAVVERLVAAGVVAHVVAIGDAEKPTPVPGSVSRPQGELAPGGPPLTRRSDAALTQLAHATGGAVVPLGVASGDLGELYRDRLAPSARGHRPPPRFSERAERYMICLSAALVLGLVGTWPSARRIRQARYGTGRRPARSWGRVVIAVVIAFLLVAVTLAANPPSLGSGVESTTARGVEAFSAGRLDAALAEFDAVSAARPTSPVGPYNAGAVLFAAGQYAEAKERYAAARARAGRNLLAKVDFALGNSTAMLGDFAAAVRHYDACLATAEQGAEQAGVRRDAAINRAFVLTRIGPPPPSPSDGEAPGGGDPDRKRAPGSNRNRPPRGNRGSDPNSPTGEDDGPDPRAADGSSGRRGPGGAGGSGAAPPGANSPEGRLDAALRRIRTAKENQPETVPSSPPLPNGRGSDKDW